MSEQGKKTSRSVPPGKTRWKKGVSGNPRGRPKKQNSLTNLLRDEIEKICPADREKRTWIQLVVLATLQLAMKGNAVALKEVWDRLDGKVLQRVGGADGKDVRIKVVYDNDDDGDDEDS